MKYQYYRADGESLRIIKQFDADDAKARAAQMALKTELKANAVFTRGGRLVAFGFTEPPTPQFLVRVGLREKVETVEGFKEETLYYPRLRTKLGKALSARMSTCSRMDAAEFTRRLLGFDFGVRTGEQVRRGARVSFCTLEKVGDDWVIGVPVLADGESAGDPEGAEPLKMSEYWALKEAAEEAA